MFQEKIKCSARLSLNIKWFKFVMRKRTSVWVKILILSLPGPILCLEPKRWRDSTFPLVFTFEGWQQTFFHLRWITLPACFWVNSTWVGKFVTADFISLIITDGLIVTDCNRLLKVYMKKFVLHCSFKVTKTYTQFILQKT